MGDRVIAYKSSPNSEDAASVAMRLRARGVEIVDEQPQMLLLSGADDVIGHVIGAAPGWKVTVEETVAPPRTRESVRKPPSD